MPIFETYLKQANRPGFWGWIEQRAIIGGSRGLERTGSPPPLLSPGHGSSRGIQVSTNAFWSSPGDENRFCPVFAVSGSRSRWQSCLQKR